MMPDPQQEDERIAMRTIVVHCQSCTRSHEAKADDDKQHVCPHCGEDDADAFYVTEQEDSE